MGLCHTDIHQIVIIKSVRFANHCDYTTGSLFSLVFIFYMIFSSLVKSLAWYYLLEFSQFICNLHLFAFGFNCQVVRLKPRDTIKNATLLAAKCGQNYLLIFYVFKICALCNRCLRKPIFWPKIMVINNHRILMAMKHFFWILNFWIENWW